MSMSAYSLQLMPQNVLETFKDFIAVIENFNHSYKFLPKWVHHTNMSATIILMLNFPNGNGKGLKLYNIMLQKISNSLAPKIRDETSLWQEKPQIWNTYFHVPHILTIVCNTFVYLYLHLSLQLDIRSNVWCARLVEMLLERIMTQNFARKQLEIQIPVSIF